MLTVQKMKSANQVQNQADAVCVYLDLMILDKDQLQTIIQNM